MSSLLVLLVPVGLLSGLLLVLGVLLLLLHYWLLLLRLLADAELFDQLLHGREGAGGAAGLGEQDLAVLAHDEDAALGALGRLLEADGADQGRRGVAQQRVGKLLLLLELGVGRGAVGGQAIDGEATRRERSVAVSEEADLGGA